MYTDLYMKEQNRSLHVMIGFAVFAMVSAGLFYFISRNAPTRASKQVVTKQEIVNVFPTQVGIFWEVETPDSGWIIYGENPSKLDVIAIDERDIVQEKQNRKYHYAILKNLTAETTYYYRIVSEDGVVSKNDEPFMVKTSSSGISSSALTPSYGKVAAQNGSFIGGSFVKLTVSNGFPLLAVTKNTGEWLIPLQHIVSKDDYSSVPISEDTVVTFRIFNDSQESNIKAVIGMTHPIPETTVLGKNYRFIGKEQVLAATNSRSTGSVSNSAILVLFPKQGGVIPGSTPLVKGNALAGKDVVITINSNPVFSASTKADADGEWSLSVKRSLAPGAYKLTMSTNDSKGKQVVIERNFTIIKSGERVGSVLAESTGSATITTTPPASPTPTRRVTGGVSVSPSPSPTLIAEAPTLTPTEILEEDLTPTATPPPPVSGISFIPYMFAGVGLVLLGAGLVLVL